MAGNNSEAEDEADNNDNVLVDEDAVSVFISRPALERGLDAVEAATNYHPESFGEAFAGMTLVRPIRSR